MKKILFLSMLMISSASMQAMDDGLFDSAELFNQLNQKNHDNVEKLEGNQDCWERLDAMVQGIPDATVCKFRCEQEELCVGRDGKQLGRGCDGPTDCRTHKGHGYFDMAIRLYVPKACSYQLDVACVKKALITEANKQSAWSKEPWCNSANNSWGPAYAQSSKALMKAYACVVGNASTTQEQQVKNLKKLYKKYGFSVNAK